jgi:hypothetical protein
MALLQAIQDNAQVQQQQADEQTKCQEASHEAQMAALSAAEEAPHPSKSRSSCNKRVHTLQVLSLLSSDGIIHWGERATSPALVQ